MAMMRTSNPALNASVFEKERSFDSSQSMTIQGTVNKAFILLFFVVLTASWVWGKVTQPAAPLLESGVPGANPAAAITPYIFGGSIGGLIFALITIFNKKIAGYTAPAYALCEGLVLGGISAVFEMQYPGIVMQAVALTFGTLFCLLMVYKSGMIKVTDNFRMGLFAATGAICLIYLVNFIMGFFGASIPMIHGNGMVGIGFSVVVVGIAALNLVLDFDFIERGSQIGCPKYMEWYGAFGLMVTLIWLYIEILRLLAKLRSRR